MSRDLSTHVADAVSAPVTEPWHLVRIGSDVRVTDGPTTTWGGETWQALPGLEVTGLSADGSGLTRATLRVPSHTGLGLGLLFAGVDDTPVTVWLVYGPGPHGEDDAALLGEAVIDGGTSEAEWAELALAAADADSREFPRHRAAPPVFNHLPGSGTRIEWAGEVLVLEPGA